MDKYTRFFIVVCVVILAAVGFILLKVGLSAYHLHTKNLKDVEPVILQLDTRSMQPLICDSLDSVGFVELVDVFLCKKQNDGDHITWADAYVCAMPQYSTPGKRDTVMVLDIGLRSELPGNAWQAGINIRQGKPLPACKIIVPKNKVKSVKRYPCRYGRIIYVIDW